MNNADLEKLREEFFRNGEESNDEFKSPCEEEIANFQGYEEKANVLDSKETRGSIKELYINENLEGELDLSDFTKLEKIYISCNIDKNNLEIKDKEKYKDKLIKLVDAQS